MWVPRLLRTCTGKAVRFFSFCFVGLLFVSFLSCFARTCLYSKTSSFLNVRWGMSILVGWWFHFDWWFAYWGMESSAGLLSCRAVTLVFYLIFTLVSKWPDLKQCYFLKKYVDFLWFYSDTSFMSSMTSHHPLISLATITYTFMINTSIAHCLVCSREFKLDWKTTL